MEKTPFWHRWFYFWYIQDYHHQYEGQKDPFPDHWARDTGAMLPTNSHLACHEILLSIKLAEDTRVGLLMQHGLWRSKVYDVGLYGVFLPKNHRIHWPSCLSRPLDHTSSTFWRMTWAGRRSVWAPAEKNHSMGWDSVLSNEWALWLVESMDSFVNEEVSSNYMAQFVDMEICASNIGASRLSDWCEIWSRVSSTQRFAGYHREGDGDVKTPNIDALARPAQDLRDVLDLLEYLGCFAYRKRWVSQKWDADSDRFVCL